MAGSHGAGLRPDGMDAVTDVDQVALAAAPGATAPQTNRDRVSRRQVDKFAERRAQLADAALQTLAELGYARTSLREIAQNTDFSHGVLHYYFTDKEDLITHCVRQYEAACVTRYDEIVATATSAAELKAEFSTAMAQTLRTDAPCTGSGTTCATRACSRSPSAPTCWRSTSTARR